LDPSNWAFTIAPTLGTLMFPFPLAEEKERPEICSAQGISSISRSSKNPKILKDIPQALVILRAGVYNEEVKNDILTNINPNIKFI
jgi:hypothetical protein